jgi:Endomembrane protein 70
MIHGDVFRSPQHLNLFSAFVGSGAQVFATVLLLLVCVLIGVFKATKRGALLTAVILIYAICGVIGGIVAGRIFKQLKGKNWVWNVVLTASVFPVPLGIVFTWVNTIAWNRESTAALPFTTIVVSRNNADSASGREPVCLLFLPPYESLHLRHSLPPAHDGYLLIRALPSDRGRSYRWPEYYV